MAIRLPCHIIGQSRNAAWVEWSATPGKAGYCEIEAAPKEMNWTDLPNIGGAKSTKHALDRDDRPEEARYGVRVIGPRLPIVSKWNGIGNFIWATVELCRAAEFPDQVQEAFMNLGNGHRAKRESCSASPCRCANIAWSRRSKAISSPTAPSGIIDVVRPRALTYRVACHEWFTQGVRASRYLPMI
jgi:hypothetical protein